MGRELAPTASLCVNCTLVQCAVEHFAAPVFWGGTHGACVRELLAPAGYERALLLGVNPSNEGTSLDSCPGVHVYVSLANLGKTYTAYALADDSTTVQEGLLLKY